MRILIVKSVNNWWAYVYAYMDNKWYSASECLIKMLQFYNYECLTILPLNATPLLEQANKIVLRKIYIPVS